MTKNRCFGNKPGQELYAQYHDEEWGRPVYDDRQLFEMLILEGAQAGLSWWTVLQRREAYRAAFHDFDPKKVSRMKDPELEGLLQNAQLIRHRGKIFSVRINAGVFLEIQKDFGSFSKYLWAYVNGKPTLNRWVSAEQVPAETDLSRRLSRDLKRRGMLFVGPTIAYAYLQAVGVVNDHLVGCFCHPDQRPGDS